MIENLLVLILYLYSYFFLASFSAGEKNKNRDTKSKLEDSLSCNNMQRDSLVIALGGGVVGDLAGFVASTYMRGIPYLQVPTSLLAMVDSSIGGKTGLDTPIGKNLIGTFWQPRKVIIDVLTLNTLPDEEMLNGVAEMIKHAVIDDERFFMFLEDYVLAGILGREEIPLLKAIKWNLTIKKKIVEKDERENSIRKKLNFGHTIGHAIEKTSDFKIKHGQAVALGMIAETKIAEELGMISLVQSSKIISLIEKSGFKTKLGKLDIKKVIDNTKFDKKNKGNMISYVLPRKIGQVDIDVQVDKKIIEKVLGDMK
jgi:3-dehydroquinate synthase